MTCSITDILWKTASPRKISLKSGNRLLSYDQKQFLKRHTAVPWILEMLIFGHLALIGLRWDYGDLTI